MNFELQLNGVCIQVSELDLPGYTAFRAVFSSSRQPLVLARSKNTERKMFWTSIPEGRQKEAEGVGKMIEEYFKQMEEK